jgi:hypothetical protein
MTEFFVVFDKDDDEIMEDAYLDLALLAYAPFPDLLREGGFREIMDHIGLTPEENAILNENRPPGLKEPWSEEMLNWTAPEVGLAMWAHLRGLLETRPELFQDWDGMLEATADTLDIADVVFRRAAARRAQWRIGVPM